MLISCPSCGAHFDLPDQALPRRVLRLQCPVCGGSLLLDSRKAAGAPRRSEPGNDTQVWLERLAGALVSDILHYNRERVEAARENDRLLAEFTDEIHLAWTDFKSRLEGDDPRARLVFIAAVNRILGDGRRIL